MKVQHILGIATIVIGSGGAAAVVKSIFPNWGLKKRKKIELNAELAKQRIEAAKEVKRIEQMANVIEFANVTHPELFQGESEVVYMSIMENMENFKAFANEINKARATIDDYLSCKVSAYLLYAEKYIMQFVEFLKYLKYTENDLYPFGLLLASDIQKWQRKLDSILVQELNNVSFEIEHHGGKEWEHEKELLKNEYEKTVLYGLIHKTNKEAMNLLCAILTEYAVNVANESDSTEAVAQRLIEAGYLTITQNSNNN